MVIKRLAAETIWRLEKRTGKRYAIDPRPGPHPKNRCLPLGYILRDVLGAASTMKEVREILNSRRVKVDGIVRTDHAFPVGIMDVVGVESSHWRVLPYKYGLKLQEIKAEEAKSKLLKIMGKTCVKGKIQLNLHDGRNIIIDKDVYRVGDALLWDIAGKKIAGHVQFKRGALGMLVAGQNRGLVGRIEDIVLIRGPQPDRAILRFEKQTKETKKDYVFVVGQDKPMVSIGQ
jgi:small subunit ribosomal protein S4e